MLLDPNAPLEITAFDWVPEFARGHVRDLRPRWACEELGLPYRERLISAVKRPDWYRAEQPWSQVPVLRDGELRLFESGAILLHLAEQGGGLLPPDPQGRAYAISWLFAAYNSVEPWIFELGKVELFNAAEEWASLRRPGLMKEMGERLDRLATALGEREWLAGPFSVADIAMVTALRDASGSGLVESRSALADYVARGTARPAFQRALEAQLAAFRDEPPSQGA